MSGQHIRVRATKLADDPRGALWICHNFEEAAKKALHEGTLMMALSSFTTHSFLLKDRVLVAISTGIDEGALLKMSMPRSAVHVWVRDLRQLGALFALCACLWAQTGTAPVCGPVASGPTIAPEVHLIGGDMPEPALESHLI